MAATILAALSLATLSMVNALGPGVVDLRTAAAFTILAETGVSTVPASTVYGDIGVSPVTNTALTGFALTADSSNEYSTSTQVVNGKLYGSSDSPPTPGRLTTAVGHMEAAYTDASGRPQPNFIELGAGLIGGFVLVPGLYKWSTAVSISTSITLFGGPSDSWIFQIAGTLTEAANVNINLSGGASASNVFWAVADTVSVGPGALFTGTILAAKDVTLETGSTDNGCIYSQTSVALQQATVTCSATSGGDGGGGTTPPPDGPCTTGEYTTTFTGLTGAIEASDYEGYTLVDTLQECLDFCSANPKCAFVNMFMDNKPTGDSTQYTCSAYASCHTAAEATNTGQDRDRRRAAETGPKTYITQSSGHCVCGGVGSGGGTSSK